MPHPQREQRQEGRVEEDEHGPEVQLAEPPVQPDPGQLRQPVVDAYHKGEDQPAHDL
jgi:hypothetical protein